jgi:hypothetical protein
VVGSVVAITAMGAARLCRARIAVVASWKWKADDFGGMKLSNLTPEELAAALHWWILTTGRIGRNGSNTGHIIVETSSHNSKSQLAAIYL